MTFNISTRGEDKIGRSYGDQYIADVMDEAVRVGFIKKVYSILVVQILMNVAIVLPFALKKIPPEILITGEFAWLPPASAGLSSFLLLVGACCPSLFRSYPTNYLVLFTVTFGQSIMVATFTAHFHSILLLQAFLITLGVFMGLTFYAWRTSREFTWMGAYINGLGFGMLAIGLIFVFIPPNPNAGLFSASGVLDLLYTIGGVMLSCLYIIYDTQLIVNGKHNIRFAVDDYAFAALNLYLDFVKLFIEVLRILKRIQDSQKRKENDSHRGGRHIDEL